MLPSLIVAQVLIDNQWIILLYLNLLHRKEFYVCYCNLLPKLMAGVIIDCRIEPAIFIFLNDHAILILSK